MPIKNDDVVVVKNLRKSFKNVHVLKGVDFSMKKGKVLALLGPNGAGKTTTVKILSTLLKPDGGKALVNGHDVVKQSYEVKKSIGLTGQYAAVDEYLTGEENLIMMGRLYRLSKKDSAKRAKELLKEFDLNGAAKRAVKTYSGGMRRRLDLAMSLIASPPIIFLDEPTTGLDPRSRMTMWEIIKKLANSGTTILLTTQYMEEADRLADRIIVLDNGKIIAEGTAQELKQKVGPERLELIISSESDFSKAVKLIGKELTSDKENRKINITIEKGIGEIKDVLNKLESGNIKIDSFSLHRPTLDDVFLNLTGRAASEEEKK